MQVGYFVRRLDQHLDRTFKVTCTCSQYAAIVEFDNFLANLIEQGLASICLAGFLEDAGDVFDQVWVIVVFRRNLTQKAIGIFLLAGQKTGVGEVDGQALGAMLALLQGFGGNLVTSVWDGRDDNLSLGNREYGGRAALPIWIDFMRVALEGMPVVENEPPEGMIRVSVTEGGRLLPTASGGGIVEWVKAEDLDRMESEIPMDYDDTPAEEAFDIF